MKKETEAQPEVLKFEQLVEQVRQFGLAEIGKAAVELEEQEATMAAK